MVNLPSNMMQSADFAAALPTEHTLLLFWAVSGGNMMLSRSLDQADTFLPPQILGNFGDTTVNSYLTPDPYLWTDYAGKVYAGWSRYKWQYRYSPDSGETWSNPSKADNEPCFWTSQFLPTDSGQLLLSCFVDESFTYPWSSSLNFDRTFPGPGGAWLTAPIRINSNRYIETGSAYGVPSVDASLIDSQGNYVVSAWEDSRTQAQGRSIGWDIFFSASTDLGLTWPSENTRLTASLPYGGGELSWVAMGPGNKAYTFWYEGSILKLDVRSVAKQIAMTTASHIARKTTIPAGAIHRPAKPSGRIHATTRKS
jgi:hypothetical protein